MSNEDRAEVPEVRSNIPVNNSEESKILGVSMRGWIALTLSLCVCYIATYDEQIRRVLEYGFTTALGFYYGQKNK